MMTIELKVLKGVLMMRQLGNQYQTKEEQIKDQMEWIEKGWLSSKGLDEWIDGLRVELSKTPEQREEEARQFREELSQREWEMAQQEMSYMRHDRDEWDDLWDDRARSCGAIMF